MSESLYRELQETIKNSGTADVGIAAHRVATGEEFLINADLAFHPASTIKVCVMMDVFHRARQGVFSLDDKLLVQNEFTSDADGSPYSLSADDDSEKDLYDHIGQMLPVQELVERMIAVSSNLATNILIERVTPQRITQFMCELGADDLLVRRGVEDNKAYQLGLNNSATAYGFMKILVQLANKKIVSTGDSAEMIRILSQQKFNEMIPAKLPATIHVAHKTGWTGDFFHDVGIVYPPNNQPIVLAILTRGFKKDDQAHALVASLAKTIYDDWTK